MEDLRHQLIQGRYYLTKSIGRGGMAQVYLAEDQKLSRLVVVKLVREDLLTAPDAAEVRDGQECGIRPDNFMNFEEGDIIEAYTVEKVAQQL